MNLTILRFEMRRLVRPWTICVAAYLAQALLPLAAGVGVQDELWRSLPWALTAGIFLCMTLPNQESRVAGLGAEGRREAAYLLTRGVARRRVFAWRKGLVCALAVVLWAAVASWLLGHDRLTRTPEAFAAGDILRHLRAGVNLQPRRWVDAFLSGELTLRPDQLLVLWVPGVPIFALGASLLLFLLFPMAVPPTSPAPGPAQMRRNVAILLVTLAVVGMLILQAFRLLRDDARRLRVVAVVLQHQGLLLGALLGAVLLLTLASYRAWRHTDL